MARPHVPLLAPVHQVRERFCFRPGGRGTPANVAPDRGARRYGRDRTHDGGRHACRLLPSSFAAVVLHLAGAERGALPVGDGRARFGGHVPWVLPCATLLAVGLSGCGAPPFARTRVSITPATASVRTGDTLRFRAVLLRAGPRRAAAVAYAARGGRIRSDGRFVAGSAPGIFPVVASVTGRAGADTSVVLVASAGARIYQTDFRNSENPLSEGHRWVGGGSVGLDWTDVSATSGLAIGHQVGAHYTDATAILGGSWRPDQTASAAVHTARQNDGCYQEASLRLRSAVEAHSNRGYEISFKMSRTSEAYLIIVRWNGRLGDFTYLLNAHGSRYGVKDGDVLSASIQGDVITAYRNGIKLGGAQDGTFTTGNPGIGFNLANDKPECRGTNGDYGFRSFTAHD